MVFRLEKPENRVLVLIDWENLQKNTEFGPPERFSQLAGFDRVIKRIARKVGEITNVYVFAPPQLASVWGEAFHQLGFFTILCPKIRTKKGEEIDTTDEIIIEFGKQMINQAHGLTHICLGSGDRDFTPLIRAAIRKGLEIVIIAGTLGSLSSKLIPLADRNKKGEKMVYLFSLTEK